MTIDRTGNRTDTRRPPEAKVGDDHSGSDAPGLEALPLPLVILASDGTIAHANGAAEAALGAPLRKLQGHPFRELIGRCWRPVFQAALSNVNGSERNGALASVTVLDLPLQTESGEIRFGISIASHCAGDEGRIHLLLHPSSPNPGSAGSTPHEAALDAAEDAILCTDLDGRILYFNGRFLEMWKIPRSALSGGLESVLSIAKEQLEEPEALMEMTDREAGEPDRESRELLQFRDRRTVERYSRPLPIGDHLVGHVRNRGQRQRGSGHGEPGRLLYHPVLRGFERSASRGRSNYRSVPLCDDRAGFHNVRVYSGERCRMHLDA